MASAAAAIMAIEPKLRSSADTPTLTSDKMRAASARPSANWTSADAQAIVAATRCLTTRLARRIASAKPRNAGWAAVGALVAPSLVSGGVITQPTANWRTLLLPGNHVDFEEG